MGVRPPEFVIPAAQRESAMASFVLTPGRRRDGGPCRYRGCERRRYGDSGAVGRRLGNCGWQRPDEDQHDQYRHQFPWRQLANAIHVDAGVTLIAGPISTPPLLAAQGGVAAAHPGAVLPGVENHLTMTELTASV
jgi:hypothetical protein